MKIAHLTDTHLCGALGTRSDEYPTTILAKWKWVCEYAAKAGADLIIHTGDVFDRAVVPRWLEHSVLQLVDESPVRHAFCVGTHDLGTGVAETNGKSIFALETQRNVYAFSGPHSVRVGDLLLCGSCAEVAWYSNAKVIAVHQMLTDVEVLWEHQRIQAIETNADFVLSGDYHPGWGFLSARMNGTVFVNPGAISRTFRAPHDLTRSPRFAMIDTNKKSFELIPVPHQGSSNIYLKKEISPMEEVKASVSAAIEDAKKKLGTDDILDMEDFQGETPAPLEAGMRRLKELCEKGEDA